MKNLIASCAPRPASAVREDKGGVCSTLVAPTVATVARGGGGVRRRGTIQGRKGGVNGSGVAVRCQARRSDGGGGGKAARGPRAAATAAAAAAGYGVRRWRAALLCNERRHVEGGDEKICQRYVWTQICRTWGGRSANLCFYDRHTYNRVKNRVNKT